MDSPCSSPRPSLGTCSPHLFPLCPYPSWITPSCPGQCLFPSVPSSLSSVSQYLLGDGSFHTSFPHSLSSPWLLCDWAHAPLSPSANPECLLYPSSTLCALSHSVVLLRLFPQLRMSFSPLSFSASTPLFPKASDGGFGPLQCHLNIPSWNQFLVPLCCPLPFLEL